MLKTSLSFSEDFQQGAEEFNNEPEIIVDLTLTSSDATTEEKKSEEESSEEKIEKPYEDLEANFNEYVKAEEEKNKPKRKTVAEMLKSIPGYSDILNKKPTIRPTSKLEIDFSEDYDDFKIPKVDPKTKGLQDLINRFKVHTSAGKPMTEQHFKVHISKKEEDSQGVNHIKVDEVDYVKVISIEEQQQQEESTSPLTIAPGVKMSQMKSKLLAEIRAKRAKQYEEKLKAHAMYSEEKDLEDKNEEEEEEILEDEISDESEIEESDEEVDEDKEEDVETLLDGDETKKKKKKKPRKRLAYFEDEADESNEGNRSVDEDEDKLDRPCKDDLSFIDDRPTSDEEEDDETNVVEKGPKEFGNNTQNFDVQEYNVYSTQDILIEEKSTSSDILMNTQQSQRSEFVSQDLFSEFENERKEQNASQTSTDSPSLSLLDPKKTPVVPASILTRRISPIGPWNSIFCHPASKNTTNNISPFPRMSSDLALDAFCKDMSTKRTENYKTPTISREVAKLVGTQEPNLVNDDELEEICSARFPSQAPTTPMESQEFDCFGFGDEDDLIASKSKVLTPVNDLMTSKIVTPITNETSKIETPKITERNRIESKRLNFQNVVDTMKAKTSVVINDDDGEEADKEDQEDVVGVKIQGVKRKRVLQFSDDEDSDASEVEEEEQEEEEVMDYDMESESRGSGEVEVNESDADSNTEYDENEEEIPKFQSIVSKKTGQIRKEFVDAEAELSGDDVDSADEDERGLDELEKEEGDEEEIDEENLRNQVGKVHLKQLLDDDQREIRYLQDVYLEQGDLYSDGKGRERQFKWRNIDNYDADGPAINDGEGVEAAEDENEAQRQKERLEKLKWMKEHSQVIEDSIQVDPDEESQNFLENSQFLKLKSSTLRKIQSVNSFSQSSLECTQSNSTTLSKRGSFLKRELSSISRLHEMTKINDSVTKSKNQLVFSVITPPSAPKDSSRQQVRKQPKKMIKVDSNLKKTDESKPTSTLFKWI